MDNDDSIVNTDLTTIKIAEPGVIPYPGRTRGKIRAGEVAWSANPITCLNPVLADRPG